MPQAEQLSAQLDRLTSWDTGPLPVVSLYLNLQPMADGRRDQVDVFLRNEFADRLATYPAEGPERDSLEQDSVKIANYLRDVDRSAQGVAVFACSGAELFEAVQ